MTLHRPRPPEDNVDSWLMSYADMITLLLAFFVVFVATSVPKQDRFAAATRGMKERFGTLSLESPFDQTYRSVTGVVVNHDADRNIAVVKSSRGMQIELSAVKFFQLGTANISDEQMPLLKELAQALKIAALPGINIEVEGFTSDQPPGNEFMSNWELAAARATRIVRLLTEEGIDPERLHASSFGPTRPAVPNEDAKGEPIPDNQAHNQRVLIVMEKIKGS